MASFRLNIARIQGCPSPKEVHEAMEAFGLPEIEEYGVLSSSATATTVFGTIVRKVQQAVQRLDTEAREVTAAAVEKVHVYPLGVRPAAESLEIYAGSAASIEQVGVFFSSCLAFPTVTDSIELDIPSAIDKLLAWTEKFQFRGVRVSEYAHSSYMSGAYLPKFLDTEHGRDFMSEYVEYVTAASVRFAAPGGRATVNLTPKACFSFSCGEDDQSFVQSILRKLSR